jgi:hypothetical protein
MEFAYPGIDVLPKERHRPGGKARLQGLVQRLAGLAEAPGIAALAAALPSGGTKTGTTNADRISKMAKPTRISITVTIHFRFEFFIRAFLSLSHLLGAIQLPDSGDALPFEECHNPTRIKLLGIFQGWPAYGKAID